MSDDPYKLPEPNPLKQLMLSLMVGVGAGAIAYVICDRLAQPDKVVGSIQTQGAYKFVFYVTALVGGLAFIITMKIYKMWADKKYRESLELPKAQQIKR